MAWLLNAALSATLSGIYDRYESRLLWLFGLSLSAWLTLPERTLKPTANYRSMMS